MKLTHMLAALAALFLTGLARGQVTGEPQADAVFAPESFIRVEQPPLDSYVVRATVPMPEGVQFELACPYELFGPDGDVYPAQWSPVTRDDDGTLAVAEVAARVQAQDGEGFVRWGLRRVEEPHQWKLTYPGGGALQLMTKDHPLKLRVVDAFGHHYEAPLSVWPFEAGNNLRAMGRARGQFEFHRVLFPTGEGPEDLWPLPYLGGVHVTVTGEAGSDAVQVDFSWHNAIEPPEGFPFLPHILYREISVVMPNGYRVFPVLPVRDAGQYLDDGGERRYTLLDDEGELEMMPQRARTSWSLVFAPDAAKKRGKAMADGYGWGVVRGPLGWQDNPRLFAQQIPAPDLSATQDQATQRVRAVYTAAFSALESGAPFEGPEMLQSDQLAAMGPFHPYGPKYGGVTGGNEIWQYPMTDLLWTGDRQGYLGLRAVHKMVTDRNWGWWYDHTGDFVEVWDIAVDNVMPHQWRFFSNSFVNGWQKTQNGWETADFERFEGFEAPSYAGVLAQNYQQPWTSMMPQDLQHGARMMWPVKSLVWMANDPLAEHALNGQATAWHIEYNEASNGKLTNDYNAAVGAPGRGAPIGRDFGWALDTQASRYAAGEDPLRARLEPYFDLAIEAAIVGQQPMGFVYASRQGKSSADVADGQYAVTQLYEEGITGNGLWGAYESVRPSDELLTCLLDHAVGLSEAWCEPGIVGGGTMYAMATAWVDLSKPAFASRAEVPADGQVKPWCGLNNQAGTIALAYRRADGEQQEVLLQMLTAMMGGSDPLTALTQNPYRDLQGQAAALGVLQTQ